MWFMRFRIPSMLRPIKHTCLLYFCLMMVEKEWSKTFFECPYQWSGSFSCTSLSPLVYHRHLSSLNVKERLSTSRPLGKLKENQLLYCYSQAILLIATWPCLCFKSLELAVVPLSEFVSLRPYINNPCTATEGNLIPIPI